MKNVKDDPLAIWYCKAAYMSKDTNYIQYIPAKREPNVPGYQYCHGKFFRTKADCQVACDKKNKATKIGKGGMKVANRSTCNKMTVRKLREFLESLENQDQEVVIYPKYTGPNADIVSKYRFTANEMQDQWHQNYPYIALMF